MWFPCCPTCKSWWIDDNPKDTDKIVFSHAGITQWFLPVASRALLWPPTFCFLQQVPASVSETFVWANKIHVETWGKGETCLTLKKKKRCSRNVSAMFLFAWMYGKSLCTKFTISTQQICHPSICSLISSSPAHIFPSLCTQTSLSSHHCAGQLTPFFLSFYLVFPSCFCPSWLH